MSFSCKSRFQSQKAMACLLNLATDKLATLAGEIEQQLTAQKGVTEEGALRTDESLEDLKVNLKKRKIAPPTTPKGSCAARPLEEQLAPEDQ